MKGSRVHANVNTACLPETASISWSVMRAALMSREKDDLISYLAAVRALQSDDPETRRPAISMLLELARHDRGVVRIHAERALTDEFGPYAVSEGLSGCSGPIEAVNACDGNCRSCVWLWEDRPILSFQPSSVVAANLDPVGDTHRFALQGSRFGQCWATTVQWCNRLGEVLALGEGATETGGGCRLAARPAR